MTRAFILLALLAVGCVLMAHADQTTSPASELQETLNGFKDELLSDPMQLAMDEGESRAAAAFQEGARSFALSEETAEFTEESEEEADAYDTAMLEGGVAKKKKKGKKNFKKAVMDMIKKGLLSMNVGKRIMAMMGKKNKKAKAKAKGKAGGKGAGGKKGGKKAAGKKAAAASTVKGADGKVLQSLQLVTGGNVKNSHCFACQYFLQRTLGALLGPFYSPKNAGPHTPTGFKAPKTKDFTAEPKRKFKQYVSSQTAFEALDRSKKSRKKFNRRHRSPFSTMGYYGYAHPFNLAEADATMSSSALEEISAIEIASVVMETFPEPSAEEAATQFSKWEHFLPEHQRMSPAPVSLIESDSEVDADADAEADAEAEVDADKKAKKGGKKAKGKKAAAAKSLFSKFGKFYDGFQEQAVHAYFTDICNRRIPTEWKPVCEKLWANLKAISEELTAGDRPDEICVRHKVCSASSYMAKRAHTAIRSDD